MDELVRKLSTLSYELIGTFFPGISLVFIVGIYCVGASYPGASPEDIRRAVLLVDDAREATFAATFLLLLVSYLAGIWIQHIASNGVWPDALVKFVGWVAQKVRVANRIPNVVRVLLLSRMPNPAKSYGESLNSVFENAAAALAARLGYQLAEEKDRWLQFYPIARTLVRRSSLPSLVQSYQNKYTLARALSYVVAMAFWFSSVATFRGLSHGEGGATMFPFLLALLSLLAVLGLISQFRYQWTIWGSILIAETVLVLSDFEPTTKATTS
jgi:hypothetical protein